VSVQLVVLAGDAEGTVAARIAAVPRHGVGDRARAGPVTVDHVRATVPAPGVAVVIDGTSIEPTLAAATPEPASVK
jgi:hypothetical protein